MSLPKLAFLRASVLPLAAALLLACSGANSSSSGTHDDSGTPEEREGGSPVHTQEGGTTMDGPSSGDSASLLDAGHLADAAPPFEGGGSLLTPNPPMGSTECGSGTITEA